MVAVPADRDACAANELEQQWSLFGQDVQSAVGFEALKDAPRARQAWLSLQRASSADARALAAGRQAVQSTLSL